MDKFHAQEDLLGKVWTKKKLHEIFTIDSKLLLLIYLKWDTTFLHLKTELLNLWKICHQR